MNSFQLQDKPQNTVNETSETGKTEISGGKTVANIGGDVETYLAGGTLVVSAGESAIDTVLSGADTTYQYADVYGITDRTRIYAGGVETVAGNGKSYDATVSSGGVQNIHAYGSAIDTSLYLGGTQNISGGSAINTFLFGGLQNVMDGVAFSNTILSGGTQNISGGTATRNNVTTGAIQNLYGGSVTITNLSGGMQNIFGGTATQNTVDAVAVQNLYGGIAENTYLKGIQNVSGGSAVNTFLSGGIQNVFTGTALYTDVLSGGTQNISNGLATLNTVATDAVQNLRGGSAAVTYLSGTQNVSGGVARDTFIYGGEQNISNGGIALSNFISSAGRQNIESGGMAGDTVVSSAGLQHVFSGGTTSDTKVDSGGIQYLDAEAVLEGIDLVGGSMHLYGVADAAAATVILDLSMRNPSDGLIINDLGLLNGEISEIRASGVLSSGSYLLAGNGTVAGSSLNIDFDQRAATTNRAGDVWSWLSANSRYNGIAEGNMRYLLKYNSNGELELYTHERYLVLGGEYADYLGEDVSYTDMRDAGSSDGVYGILTTGEEYLADLYGGGKSIDIAGTVVLEATDAVLAASLYGGGEGCSVGATQLTLDGLTIGGSVYGGGNANGAVNGNVFLTLVGGTVSGLIVGGGRNSYVAGDITLAVGNELKNDVYGGGYGGDVGGTIELSFSGSAGVAGKFIYAGGTGSVNANGTGRTAISLTIDTEVFDNFYHVILGTCNTSEFSNNATVYGDVELNLISNGASSTDTTGQIFGGSYRNLVGGTSLIVGKSTLNLSDSIQTNMTFGGGYAVGNSTSGTVISWTVGGTEINLHNFRLLTFGVFGGGRARGVNAVSRVGGNLNSIGTLISITGNTSTAAVIAGGYAENNGLSEVYGNSTVSITGSSVTTGTVVAGGYASGGQSITYGKGILNVTGAAQTDYFYGGGYATAGGTVALTVGTDVTLSGYSNSAVSVFGGGYSRSTGSSVVGGNLSNVETSGADGSWITISDSMLRSVFGGGYAGDSSSNYLYGGSHIILNNVTAAKIYGGGYADNVNCTSILNGGVSITVNGGTFTQGIFGGGASGAPTGQSVESTVYGGTYILLNCTSNLSLSNVYGGGGGNTAVYGGSVIEFTGLGSNLSFLGSTNYIIGTSNQGRGVDGIKELRFTDFSGSVAGTYLFFDTITVSNSSVAWTVSQSLASVSNWNFDLIDGATALNWAAGSNNFSGDVLNLNFESTLESATVLQAGSTALLNGWDSFGSVSFNGAAGTWNSGLSAWTDAGNTWKLELSGGTDLIISKIV